MFIDSRFVGGSGRREGGWIGRLKSEGKKNFIIFYSIHAVPLRFFSFSKSEKGTELFKFSTVYVIINAIRHAPKRTP